MALIRGNVVLGGLLAAFVATVLGANWAVDRYGIVDIGFGLMAPAGVFFAGFAFGLRDALQEAGGRRCVIGAIVAGAALAFIVEDDVTILGGHTAIALASGAAFLLSELVDFLIYEPLRRRRWTVAVVASNVVGAAVDSAVFLWLGFGSIDFLPEQVVGKSYMILVALPVVWWMRRRFVGGRQATPPRTRPTDVGALLEDDEDRHMGDCERIIDSTR